MVNELFIKDALGRAPILRNSGPLPRLREPGTQQWIATRELAIYCRKFGVRTGTDPKRQL